MAVRNTKLGGSDWVVGNFVDSDDLNDTFDKFYNDARAFL